MLNMEMSPPIVLASVVSIATFAFLWRAGRESDRVGTPTWTFMLIAVAYAGPVGAFIYFSGSKAVSGSFDIFMTALAANMMAMAIVYALLNTFVYTRGQSLYDRIPAMIGALVLLGGTIAASLMIEHH